MKKLFVLSSILALGALSSFAQGSVNANNQSTGVLIQVKDLTGVIANGAATTIGKPATAAGFGTGSGPGAVAIALYAAPLNTSAAALEATTPIWTGFNSASGTTGNQGTVAPGGIFALPAPYDGTASVEFAFYGVTGDGKYSGWSTIGTVTPLASSITTSTSPNLWGNGAGQITSMVLTATPEPATIALGGLGAAALLLFRRRK